MHGSSRELVSFFTMQFVQEQFTRETRFAGAACRDHMIAAMLVWVRQAQRLAAALADAANESTSVHVFTPCIPAAQSSAISRAGGAPVVVHNSHGSALLSAIAAMKASQLAVSGWHEWAGRLPMPHEPKTANSLELTGLRLGPPRRRPDLLPAQMECAAQHLG